MEFNEIIITTLDLSNYNPKSKLYIDYEKLLDKKFNIYKNTHQLKSITDDIVDEHGDIILSVEMQELNQDAVLKEKLKEEIKIEITNDNLLDYFEEKPKTDIEVLQEKVEEYDNLIQDLLFNVLPSMINTEE